MTAAGSHSTGLTLCMINYNGERYLQESLGSVVDRAEQFSEILVIDNASQDGSLRIIRDRFPGVRVIALDWNGGPAVARNVAFESASSDRILFMDNDVSLGPDCAEHLMRALDDHPTAALAMPRVVYAGAPDTVQYDGAGSHFLGLMILHNENCPVSLSPRETRTLNSIVTACFLMDKKRWGGDRPFDDSFFIYLEDHDFGVRTRLMGHEILSVPDAFILHREGTEGLSLRQSGRYSKMRILCLVRNRWRLIWKNYSVRTLILLAPVLFIYEITQLLMVLKKGWLGQWLQALWSTVRSSGTIARERRSRQKARRTPDREILSGGPIPFREELTESRLERTARSALNWIVEGYWNHVRRFV